MSRTLLLADDSVTIQRVIELTFADEDVQVVAVSDGDQAIARLDAEPPDIVLADIGMPGKNGYEVAAYIKQTPRLAHIPVVLLTGAFEPVDQAKATAAGCDGVLAKPFEPQLVIGRVRELLARAGAQPAAAPSASQAPAQAERPLVAVPSEKTPVLDEVERYFDRLDAAFATLNKEAPSLDKADVAPPSPVRTDLEWISAPPIQTAPDAPLSYASPAAAFDRMPASDDWHDRTPEPSSVAPVTPVEPSTFAAAPTLSSAPAAIAPFAFPPIAEAFAAILAAEQGGPVAAEAVPWPATSPATDDLVERVARRVLDQLSDRVIRETVTERVSAITERLVREEIERIKSSIK